MKLIAKLACIGLLTMAAASLATVLRAGDPAPSSAFAPTIPNKTPPPGPAPKGMVWVPGGEFSMGCEAPSEEVCTRATMNAVNDAKPIHRVYVDGFWMDKNDVSNEEFARFVAATGYVTVAERTPTKEEFPTAQP